MSEPSPRSTAVSASHGKRAPTAGRTLAIGDIHGCRAALQALLAMIQPGAADTVVTLGDYVDRGPDSRDVVDLVLKLAQSCQLIPLLGNHEQMLLEAADDPDILTTWLMYGGLETLTSYDVPRSEYTRESIPAAHRDFFARCRAWYETETHLFVHAGLEAHLPLEQQKMEVLRWDRLRDYGPHMSGKTVICGHTRQINGLPLNLGHTICIDTWVYGAGWLTCLDVATGRYWQANQHGESREGHVG